MSLAAFRALCVLGLTVTVLLRCASATGYIDFSPSEYHNPNALDSQGGGCDIHAGGCDHYFNFCATGAGTQGACNYGSRTTPHAENTYRVVFTTGALGTLPFRFGFVHYPGSFVMTVNVWDDDGSSPVNPDDFIETLTILKSMNPGESLTGRQDGSRGRFLLYSVFVGCDPNYYGTSCDIVCEPQDSSVSGHYTCGSQGEKICREGWNDPFTNCLAPICTSRCDQGTCVGPNSCSCNTGYSGALCSTPICAAGCNNGYCNSPGECICQSGYSGFLCVVDERFCERQNPCQNGGACEDTGPNQYQCNCPYGYTGSTCDSTYDVCSVEGFCANGGNCSSEGTVVGQFECSCVAGYTGVRCEDLVDNCGAASCQNGATCVNALLSFTCQCAPGYTGDSCEVDIDDCASNPCKNGGTCFDEPNDFYCVCPASVANAPKDCAGPLCFYHNCENDGKCGVSTSGGVETASCVCKQGFAGHYCEFNVTTDKLSSSGQISLSQHEVVYVAVGCSVGGVFVCILCVALCFCCVGCYRSRRYKDEANIEQNDYEEDADHVAMATKIKQMEINNPQYATTSADGDENHIYDHVSTIKRDNPYEDVTLGLNPPEGYSTINGSPYGNTSPTTPRAAHTYPDVSASRSEYATPSNSAPSPVNTYNIPTKKNISGHTYDTPPNCSISPGKSSPPGFLASEQ